MSKGKTVEVTIKLDEKVLRDAMKILTLREMSLDTFVRMALRQVRKNGPLDLQDVVTFGKYYGETLSDIIKADPRYVDWLMKNKESFLITEEALELLNEVQAV